jgi:cysteine desulfurase
VTGVRERVEEVTLTGHPEKRLPGHASFCFKGIEGESLVFMLAQSGIYSNTGSACASKALKTSPVLVAIGISPELAQGSIVFTLDLTNRVEEIEYILEKLSQAVAKLRSFSPIWGRKAPVDTEVACEH